MDEDKMREILSRVGVNYDDYKDDGLALLDIIEKNGMN